jgi:hypothetical protein
MSGIPVAVAERVATDYNKEQVILICGDNKDGTVSFTTYGKTATDKLTAAKVCYLMRIHFFDMEVPDGSEAPIGFENFEWSNEVQDFVEKENG